MSGRTFTVKDVCERYGVDQHTVLAWIKSGELKALSVSVRPGSKRPRWRITEQAIAAFELSRTPAPPLPRARRRKPADDVISFY
jgi:excisionase family DNA binding protein